MQGQKQKKYALIIDDEVGIRELMKTIMENLGYEVTLYGSGKEAIDLMKKNRPHFDVVFLDVIMPQVDGVETCKILKEIEPTLNIVMMTGYAVTEKLQECMQYGIIDYLYKPFDIAQIEDILENKILKREKLKDSPSLKLVDQMKEKKPAGNYPYHILIVDDEHMICTLLKECIKRELSGIQVHIAYNGEEALESMKQHNIDLIVSDIRMPHMNGMQLLKKVKKMDPEKEVILITGYADMETAIEAVSLGAYDYIQKPFKSNMRVTNTVKHALEQFQMRKDQKRLTEKLQKRVHELDMLYDVSKLSTYMFDHQQLMGQISRALKEIVCYYDMANLLLLTGGKQDLITQIGSPVSKGFVEEGRKRLLKAYNILTDSNFQMKDLNIYVDVNRQSKGEIHREIRTSFNVPLMNHKSVIGMLNVSSHKKNAFTETAIKLFYTLCNSLSSSLRKGHPQSLSPLMSVKK